MSQQIAIMIKNSKRTSDGLRGAADFLAGGNRVKVFFLCPGDAQSETGLQQWHVSGSAVTAALYAMHHPDEVSLTGIQKASMAEIAKMLKQADHVITY